MKTQISRFFKWALAILGIGVSSCDVIQNAIDDVGGGAVCMYGCPNMDYVISGKVTSEEGDPIKGIWVSAMQYPDGVSDEKLQEDYDYMKAHVPGEICLTSEDGSYILSSNGFPLKTLTVHFVDVDGAENGSYERATAKAELVDTKEKKPDTWYSGKFSAKDVNATMKTKDAE